MFDPDRRAAAALALSDMDFDGIDALRAAVAPAAVAAVAPAAVATVAPTAGDSE